MHRRPLLLAQVLLLAPVAPVWGGELPALSGSVFGGLDYAANLFAYGTVYAASQPQRTDGDGLFFGGAATLSAGLSHGFADGTGLGLDGSFYLAHGPLDADNYDSAFVQKIYGRMETSAGRFEIGMTDGAAFALALTGPAVNDETSIESHNAAFFRNPVTDEPMTAVFALNSAVETSFNFAKIAYYTPEISGFRFGFSYAPSEARHGLPFVAGAHEAGDQRHLSEAAAHWAGRLGPFETAASFGVGFARRGRGSADADDRTNLFDWAAGAEFVYPCDDDGKFSFGGAYHQSNAYGFDVDEALKGGAAHSAHLAVKWEAKPWAAGGEWNEGTTRGLGVPRVGLHGFGAAVGRSLSENWTATVGWQRLAYASDTAFYTGGRRLRMDAVFLHLRLDA